jgi:uncharacterized membrane protein SpoIIM required for sporulation
MITEDDFILRRRPEWDQLDRLLASRRALHRLAPTSISRAASLYRALTTDLMRARTAGYSGDTITYLDALAARAHNALYGAPPYRLSAVIDLVARDFPRTVRRRAAFFAFAAALFLVPALVGFWAAKASASFAAEVLPTAIVESMEESYSKPLDRAAGENVLMAGFYVNNNIGIAFRCFATGVLFGLGSVFFLVYNGLLMGTVAGMLARTGHGMNLLTFCCGHSPFELTAIVISGMAGLRMGYALVATGGRTRWGSLRQCAEELAHLVFGAAIMLLIAAFIEGFWSPSAVLPPVKWGVAVVLSVAVASYLTLAGREHAVSSTSSEKSSA